MPDATFTRPDLITFTRLDDLGLEVVGQLLEPDRAVLACRVVEPLVHDRADDPGMRDPIPRSLCLTKRTPRRRVTQSSEYAEPGDARRCPEAQMP